MRVFKRKVDLLHRDLESQSRRSGELSEFMSGPPERVVETVVEVRKPDMNEEKPKEQTRASPIRSARSAWS
jgi:hypothetical protein